MRFEGMLARGTERCQRNRARGRLNDAGFAAIVAAVVGRTVDELAENGLEREVLDDRVTEGRLEVDGVVVSAAGAADVEHLGASQITNQAPDSSLRKCHFVRYLADRAFRMHRNVEKDRSVARDEVPMVMNNPAFVG